MTDHSGKKYLFVQPKLTENPSGWILSVNLTLKLSTSKEKRIGWYMHSVEVCKRFTQQP